MIRIIKYTVLALIAAALLIVALANRQMVTLQLLPGDLAAFVGVQYDIRMPLFVIVLGGVALGLMIGFFWEWMREYRYRAEARRARRELARRGGAEPAQKTPDDELAELIGESPRTPTRALQ